MPELSGINYERRGAGPPLLLLHGIGSRWEVWSPVMDRLAEERDVIAVDLPGFGRSPAPAPGTRPGVPTLVDLVEGFLADLEVSQPHVAGNSMGGWMAIEMARRGSAASAVGLSPAGFYNNRDRPYIVALLGVLRTVAKLGRPLLPLLLKPAIGRKLSLSSLVAHPERMPAAEAVLSVQGLADSPWFWPNLPAVARGAFHGGAEITVPVTVAWGNRDHLLRPHQAATALAEIPQAAFVSLPDCGHLPTFDNPGMVAEVILRATAVARG